MKKDIKLEQFYSISDAADLLYTLGQYIKETKDIIMHLQHSPYRGEMMTYVNTEWTPWANKLQKDIQKSYKSLNKTKEELEDRVIDTRPVGTITDLVKYLNETTEYEWVCKGGEKYE